jgi:hypothetical protein
MGFGLVQGYNVGFFFSLLSAWISRRHDVILYSITASPPSTADY